MNKRNIVLSVFAMLFFIGLIFTQLFEGFQQNSSIMFTEKSNLEAIKLEHFIDSDIKHIRLNEAFETDNQLFLLCELFHDNMLYSLYIWKLDSLISHDFDSINGYTVADYYELSISPKKFLALGQPRINFSSKASRLTCDTFSLLLPNDIELKSRYKTKSLLYFNMKSKGLALADEKMEVFLKIDMKTKNQYQCCIKNDGNNATLIYLAVPNFQGTSKSSFNLLELISHSTLDGA